MEDLTDEFIATADLSPRQRYRLLTSVVVPRPIGWLSTRSAAGIDNLAPFSFFNAVSATPMLVVAGIGSRADGAKDTLTNVRESGAFCYNMVTEKHVEQMNLTAGDYPAGVSEFDAVGIAKAEASRVDAPYVADCPVVLECRLAKEVDLEGAGIGLIVGEVVAARVSGAAGELWQNGFLDVSSLRPVGRLWAGYYTWVDRIFRIDRPVIDRATGEMIEPPKS